MRFADQSFILPVAGRSRRVVIQGDLLKLFWSAFDGPQTAEVLMYANREMWADLVAERLARGLENPGADDAIRLSSLDWEG